MKSQKIAEENESCYKIMNEVENFGINDRQRYFLIYLLTKNLEDVEVMQELMTAIKEINPNAFITNHDDTVEPDVTKPGLILDN